MIGKPVPVFADQLIHFSNQQIKLLRHFLYETVANYAHSFLIIVISNFAMILSNAPLINICTIPRCCHFANYHHLMRYKKSFGFSISCDTVKGVNLGGKFLKYILIREKGVLFCIVILENVFLNFFFGETVRVKT